MSRDADAGEVFAWVVLALLEVVKNLVVYRLKDGRKHAQEEATKAVKLFNRKGKKMKPGMLTQTGKAKSMESKSWLASCKPPTAADPDCNQSPCGWTIWMAKPEDREQQGSEDQDEEP